MSQMYPSSSQQLVAAAFRRARKKFPTNFGELSWPIQYDKKSEQLQSVTTCRRCENRFASSEIRNVRSSNVWPQFTSFWSTDPRSTRSMRENTTLPGRRKVPRRNCVGCDCRRICESTKRNVVVSFSDEGKSNSRCSGGDVAEERTSIETISRKSCRSCARRTDCSTIERFDDAVDEEEKNKKNNEKKSKAKHRSCIHENERLRNLAKIDRLNLLYNRSTDRTKNSVPFSSNRKESDANDSPEEEEAGLHFPNELKQWENTSLEDTLGSESRLGGVMGDEIVVNCSCAGKNEPFRNDNYRGYRRHSHQPRFERNQCPHDSSLCRELLLRRKGSRASSTAEETNRLCKDCARGKCSRNWSIVPSLLEDENEEQCSGGGGRGDDVCAIKHKDSMAILVEKFKNKRNPNSCSDDETIFKSDEETPTSRTRNGEKKILRGDKGESEDFESDDVARCKVHGSNTMPEAEKFYKNFKCLKSRSGCCCSLKEDSCHRAL